MSMTREQRQQWRHEAGLGICLDPRREFGRDYRILDLIEAIEEAEEKCAAWQREHQYVCDERDRLRNAALSIPPAPQEGDHRG